MPGMTLAAAGLLIDRAIAEARQEFKRPICVSVLPNWCARANRLEPGRGSSTISVA